jgi:hypothetical protein
VKRKTHAHPARKTGGGAGEGNNGFTTALIPAFSPREKEWRWHVSGFADARPANPVARIFRKAADDSPSPWGEGRDEGERSNQFLSRWEADGPAQGRLERSAGFSPLQRPNWRERWKFSKRAGVCAVKRRERHASGAPGRRRGRGGFFLIKFLADAKSKL